MQVQVMKSKIHGVKITQAKRHYVGSITVDKGLMDAADIVENEKVQVVNINNGERLETYIITGTRNTGEVCLNGPAAGLTQVGDIVILITYGLINKEESKAHVPIVIFPDNSYKLVS